MHPCSEVIALLVDYLEHQLPAPVQADLERHLSHCASCVAYVRSYQNTVSLLHSLREQDLPDELRYSLRAFLDRRHDSN
jgi:anti-sigma factor RsiW